jgi:nicotinamide mononucleotide adenylyltransferase
MSGIKHLNEIYEKKGKEFTEKLFSSELTVTENLDGSSFSFEKDFTGNNISFYKKDQDNPITRVDRILMTYYEKPINYISSLPDEIRNELPAGWRFGMTYFPNNKPIRIEYERVPKNHLILTHIIIKDEFGDNVRSIQSKEELEEWADKIGVERPPVIFQGKLSEDQKLAVMDFVTTPLADLKNKFKTESFSKFLISILNPSLESTTLGKDLYGQIDSLIFRFKGENGEEDYLAKAVDPIFYEISQAKKPAKSSYFPNDIYSLTLIDVMNFMLEIGVENFTPEGTEPEDRYISFVFDVFKKFIEQEGEKYISADFQKPEYLQSPEFSINKDLIADHSIVDILDEESYEVILQMILNSFRKYKRKPHGFFTEGLIEQFNQLVDEIASYINRRKKENIHESSGIPYFISFKKSIKNFKVFEENEENEEMIEEKEEEIQLILESMESKEKDGSETSEFFSFKDFKKVVSTNKERKKIKIINEEKQASNIVIGKFQPFNNGHLKMCTRVKKENNLPVFLCVVHPGTTSKKYPFSKELIRKSISSLVSENGNLFSGYCFIESPLLEDALSKANEKVNVSAVCVGESGFEDMVLQREWIKNKYDTGERGIEIFKTPIWSNNSEVRNFIQNSDFQGFKSKVPKSISLIFNEFEREIKLDI